MRYTRVLFSKVIPFDAIKQVGSLLVFVKVKDYKLRIILRIAKNDDS